MSDFPQSQSPQSETFTPSSPFRPPSILAPAPSASVRDSSAHADAHGGSTGASTPPRQHIALTEPSRPALPARLTATARGESHRSMSEALRLARSRQEQEELLDDEEQADDDGCYQPRKNDDPRVPNPHGWLPVYTSIHKIRRLVVASIGRFILTSHCPHLVAHWQCARFLSLFAREEACDSSTEQQGRPADFGGTLSPT